MKINKEYTYSNKRQIWRLIPTDSEKLIIEERDTDTKEVYYNCLDINTGEKIFTNFQPEEKIWSGIESIYNDVIFFHKFGKPDMPGHLGITAYEINSGSVLWSNESYIFLFVLEDKLYCYNNTFEGRDYYTVDYRSGELLDELGEDSTQINSLREESFNSFNYENYLFPSPFNPDNCEDAAVEKLISRLKTERVIKGSIEFISAGDVLLLTFHEVLNDGYLSNIFMAIDIFSEKVIFKDVLNKSTKSLIPDSFFVKDKLIFLLQEKDGLSVCSLNY